MNEIKEKVFRRPMEEMTFEVLEAGYTKCSNKVLQKALNMLRKFDTRYYLEQSNVRVTIESRILGIFPKVRHEYRWEYRLLRRSATGEVMSIKLRSVDDSSMCDILTAEEVNAWIQGKIFDLKPAAKAAKIVKPV